MTELWEVLLPMRTWQTPHEWGHPSKRSGYSLTVNYEENRYDDLASALAAFDEMARQS